MTITVVATIIFTIILALLSYAFLRPASRITESSSPSTSNSNSNSNSSPTLKQSSKNEVAVQKRKFRNSVSIPNPILQSLLAPVKSLEGYLKKKSNKHWGSYQQRYFIISGAYLLYFNSKLGAHNDAMEPMGAIDIRHIVEIKTNQTGKALTLTLSDGTLYELVGADFAAAQAWEDNLGERMDILKKANSPAVPLMTCKTDNLTEAGRKNVTPEELSKLDEMKQTYPSVDQATMLRFLRARKGKVEAANVMLREHLEWRRRTFPITKERVISQIRKKKFVLTGFDRDGDPIIYIVGRRLGKHTYESLEEHMDSVYYMLEVVCSRLLLDAMSRFTIIYNRVGVDEMEKETGLDTGDSDWVKEIGKTLAKQYPERMKMCIVVPTSRLFRWVWSVIKHFFDPVTVAKISFAGKNEDLLRFMTADNLVEDVGGTNTYIFDAEHIDTLAMVDDEEYVKRDRHFNVPQQMVYEF